MRRSKDDTEGAHDDDCDKDDVFPPTPHLVINKEINGQISLLDRAVTDNDRQTTIDRECQMVADIDRQ